MDGRLTEQTFQMSQCAIMPFLDRNDHTHSNAMLATPTHTYNIFPPSYPCDFVALRYSTYNIMMDV